MTRTLHAVSPQVALLIDHETASVVAIQRATRVSDALDATLQVVLAVDEATPSDSMLVISHVADLLETDPPRRGFDLEVVRGSLSDVGFAMARAASPILAVVDARLGARLACRLSDTLRAPVLVARDSRDGGELIAASDLQARRLPVLAAARSLGRALDRDVIYFHNARPTPIYLTDPMAGPSSYTGMLELQDDLVAAKRTRLRGLAEQELKVDSVVARDLDTVGAVLELARDRDADMLVVGHRPRSWLGRLFGRGTAERIVARSRRSVLIVPLEGR